MATLSERFEGLSERAQALAEGQFFDAGPGDGCLYELSGLGEGREALDEAGFLCRRRVSAPTQEARERAVRRVVAAMLGRCQ